MYHDTPGAFASITSSGLANLTLIVDGEDSIVVSKTPIQP